MRQNLSLKPNFEGRLEHMGGDIGVLKTDVSVLRTDVSVLKTDVNVLKEDVSMLKKDVSVLKEDVSMLKKDVSVLKEDVRALKGDVSVLKSDVSDLKQDVKSLKKDTNYLKENAISTAIQLKQLEIKVDNESAETRRQMLGFRDEVLTEFKTLHQELTMLTGPYRRCEDGLEDHDKRISHLESKVFVRSAS